MSPTGCGCGKGSKPRAAKTAPAKTSGAWKLTGPNGEVSYHDSRVSGQASNLRLFGGKGVVVKN